MCKEMTQYKQKKTEMFFLFVKKIKKGYNKR